MAEKTAPVAAPAVGDLLAGREHWHRYCWPGPWIAADHDSVLLHLQERTVLP